MSTLKVNTIQSNTTEQVTINSDVKFVGVICASTVYVGETVITSGGTSSNQGYIWLLSEPISPGNKPSPNDNYFNIELFSGLTSNTLNPNNLLKIKVNNGDTSSTSREVWWASLQQNYQNALLQITYAGNASNSATIQISNMFGIGGNNWQINGKVISGPPSGQTFPVYERHYLNWSFGPSSGGTISGNSFNQAADFQIFTGSVINITGTSAITYFSFNYTDSLNYSHYYYLNDFISSTTSEFTVDGDFSNLIPDLPITTTDFNIQDANNDFDLNKYYYNLPTITGVTYNSGSNISTFIFSPSLETTYYEVQGYGSSTVGTYSTAEGLSVNAFRDYSHAEGSYTTTGIKAFYSSSIVDGVITIENMKIYHPWSILYIEKENKQFILFNDSIYDDNYGNQTLAVSSSTYNESGQTITIYLDDTSINTSQALIACTSIDTDYIYPYGYGQHSEGFNTIALGEGSHAEGTFNIALGEGSHVEGIGTVAGPFSHAEGEGSNAFGYASHAEGNNTKANNDYSHAEGYYSEAYGYASHAEGRNTFSINEYSHTEGSATFTPSYYTYITAVDTGTRIITVTNTDNFNVNDPVAYVYNASGNNNQIRKTFIKSINYTGKTFTLDSVNSINSSIFWGLNGNLNGIGVLFRLDANDFTYNHSEGSFTVAIGDNSHSEGRKTAALGNHSHAEGVITQAAGAASHAEGILTQANGDNSHAEGDNTKAGINAIPADVLSVCGTTVLRLSSSFGDLRNSISFYDLSYGDLRYYYKNNTKIEFGNLASTIVEYNGSYTYITASTELPTYLINQEISIYNPRFSRIENEQIYPDGNPYNRFGYASHAEGYDTISLGEGSHAEGDSTKAYGDFSHAEGYSTEALGYYSHAEGYSTEALGDDSHAEGFSTIALGEGSHAEGEGTLAGYIGYYSTNVLNGNIELNNNGNDLSDVFIVGQSIVFDDRDNANAYGFVQTTISAVTYNTPFTYITLDNTSVNGPSNIYLPNDPNPRLGNQSIGSYSHAEGSNTASLGRYSHSEGYQTLSIGRASHSEGEGTIALKDYSHASGRYNKSGNTDSIMVVGNGTDNNNRSDIFYINENSVNVEGRFDNGYRTYRALLTHTDSQSITQTPTYGLIVGETYKIATYVAGDDFLSVGATTNQTEEQFTATGRYPTKWLCGSTLTVETPTFIVNVLENSFDVEIVWEFNPYGEGSYGAYFLGDNQRFQREKTSIVTSPITPYGFAPFAIQPTIYSLIESDLSLDDYLVLYVNAYDGYNNYSYNNLLWNTPIEIKSYVGFKPTVYLNSFTPNYQNCTADFDVTLASSGSSTVTEFGVVWSMSPNPTIADYKQILGTQIGTNVYTVDFNGTTCGNITYVRAYAINRAGVSYHEVNQISFIPND